MPTPKKTEQEKALGRWTRGLRSGRYKQTRNWLRIQFVQKKQPQSLNGPERAGYCCFGVACELYLRAHPKDKATLTTAVHCAYLRIDGYDTSVVYRKTKAYGGYTRCLPPVVREWLGITSNQEGELTGMNDAGKTFQEIADRIDVIAALNAYNRSIELLPTHRVLGRSHPAVHRDRS